MTSDEARGLLGENKHCQVWERVLRAGRGAKSMRGGWIDAKDVEWTYGLLVDALRSVVGRGSGHLLGGKGLSDLWHFGWWFG